MKQLLVFCKMMLSIWIGLSWVSLKLLVCIPVSVSVCHVTFIEALYVESGERSFNVITFTRISVRRLTVYLTKASYWCRTGRTLTQMVKLYRTQGRSRLECQVYGSVYAPIWGKLYSTILVLPSEVYINEVRFAEINLVLYIVCERCHCCWFFNTQPI